MNENLPDRDFLGRKLRVEYAPAALVDADFGPLSFKYASDKPQLTLYQNLLKILKQTHWI